MESTITLTISHMITIIAGLLAAAWTFGKILLSQINRMLELRFSALEHSRQQYADYTEKLFSGMQAQINRQTDEHGRLSFDVASLRSKLTDEYLRQIDHDRQQASIEKKIDEIRNLIRHHGE